MKRLGPLRLGTVAAPKRGAAAGTGEALEAAR
jgi:hypothetical protein